MSVAVTTAVLVQFGYNVGVFCVDHPSDGLPVDFDPRVKVIACAGSWGGRARVCPELWQRVKSTSCKIIHSHGLWTDVNRVAAEEARRRNIPHLIATHGMLQPQAMMRSWWKKLPARWFFQDRALRDAACILVNSQEEYLGIRRYGLRNPVALVPNPIIGPPDNKAFSIEEFRRRYGIPAGKRCLLYMGRIHPVKGLLRLAEAWALLRRFHEEWTLVVAGPDEVGFQAVVSASLKTSSCEGSVVFTGSLDNIEKWEAYAAANLFVMPSDFENFGMSIAEALLAGVPVITTTGTPWKRLADLGVGWWVDASPHALAEAMREAMELPSSQLGSMGASCRNLVGEFHPEIVVGKITDVYQWMLGCRRSPDCIISY